jgi:predicted nuclease of predicted toxin-antitoxin system
MARLLADENFPLPVVLVLRSAGHDVRTALEAGLLATADPVVLAAATADARAVLTQDRDYIRLHKLGPVHAGIVFVTRVDDVFATAARIDAAIAGQADLTGQLICVYRPQKP